MKNKNLKAQGLMLGRFRLVGDMVGTVFEFNWFLLLEVVQRHITGVFSAQTSSVWLQSSAIETENPAR